MGEGEKGQHALRERKEKKKGEKPSDLVPLLFFLFQKRRGKKRGGGRGGTRGNRCRRSPLPFFQRRGKKGNHPAKSLELRR